MNGRALWWKRKWGTEMSGSSGNEWPHCSLPFRYSISAGGKMKKTFAFSDDPIVRYFNSFLSIISANWIFYFLFKKKVPPPNEWKFLQSKFFQISKKIWSIPSNWSEIFFSTKKCNLERKDNKWMKKRNEKKRKVRDGRRLCGCPTHFLFFWLKIFFFSLKFHFPRSEKKWNFPNILNEWTFRWKKNSDFFFFKTKFRFVSEQDANWSWSVN